LIVDERIDFSATLDGVASEIEQPTNLRER
jgi:hypothetical protein